MDEDITDITALISNSAGIFIDRVNENFEPFTIDAGDVTVGCANVNVDFPCETPISDFIPILDCTACLGGVSKAEVLTNRWCKAEEEISSLWLNTIETVPDSFTFAAK